MRAVYKTIGLLSGLYTVMRFKLSIIALAVSGLQGASTDSPAKITIKTVVRADAYSGRLVRASVVASRVVPEKVVLPAPPPAAPTLPQPGATVNALVANIARRHDVEPSLVDSVIRVES